MNVEINMKDIPDEIGLYKKSEEEERVYRYKDTKHVLTWVKEQLQGDNIKLTLTGIIPPWMAISLGCCIPYEPVDEVWTRSNPDGAPYLAWKRPEEGEE